MKNGGYAVSEDLKTAYESYIADAKKKAEAELEAKAMPKVSMEMKLPRFVPTAALPVATMLIGLSSKLRKI